MTYTRTFNLPLTKGWKGSRVRLVFEAVDYETEVRVNGEVVGTHRGGYDRFSFDISDKLKRSGREETLTVTVKDPTDKQVRRKQSNSRAHNPTWKKKFKFQNSQEDIL